MIKNSTLHDDYFILNNCKWLNDNLTLIIFNILLSFDFFLSIDKYVYLIVLCICANYKSTKMHRMLTMRKDI